MAFEGVLEGAGCSVPYFDRAICSYFSSVKRDMKLECCRCSQQVAIHFPSGENLTAATPLLWPFNVMYGT